MPMQLEGACRCAAVRFTVASSAPHPYQLCYCSICRKSAGSGGYAINILADNASLAATGRSSVGRWHAVVDGAPSPAERSFCTRCGSPLWLWDPRWPDLLHPHASAIDTPLPVPPARVHILLGSKAPWVEPAIGPDDRCFEGYPEESIEAWHRARGIWLD